MRRLILRYLFIVLVSVSTGAAMAYAQSSFCQASIAWCAIEWGDFDPQDPQSFPHLIYSWSVQCGQTGISNCNANVAIRIFRWDNPNDPVLIQTFAGQVVRYGACGYRYSVGDTNIWAGMNVVQGHSYTASITVTERNTGTVLCEDVTGFLFWP